MTPEDAVAILVRRGLVTARDIVQGELRVEDASRRNRNFRVTSNDGVGYFLKHAHPEWGEHFRTVSNEAAFYSLVRDTAAYASLQSFLPSFCFHDPEAGVLLVELCRGASTAREVAVSSGSGVPRGIAVELGRSLGSCHSVFSRSAPPPMLAPKRPPWALSMTRPRPDALREATSFQVDMLKLLQQERDLDGRLADLARQWAATTLIHGDIRWDNVLVRSPTGNPAGGVVLVDWELWGLGDPSWDLGSVFQEYLSQYTASRDVDFESHEAVATAFADGLPEVRAEVPAFWESYVEATSLPAGSAAARLDRAVAYCGASLLQAGFAWARNEGDIAVHLLQLGLNVLRDPRNAQEVLLGIPSAAERT